MSYRNSPQESDDSKKMKEAQDYESTKIGLEKGKPIKDYPPEVGDEEEDADDEIQE